jgi:predicted RNA binding protein YcfA (HicA-like mRNA interferase family)
MNRPILRLEPEMPRKLRELRADLRQSGWQLIRQTGSHQTWQHPSHPGVSLRLSGHDGDDAKPYQERDVARAVAAASKEQQS